MSLFKKNVLVQIMYMVFETLSISIGSKSNSKVQAINSIEAHTKSFLF